MSGQVTVQHHRPVILCSAGTHERRPLQHWRRTFATIVNFHARRRTFQHFATRFHFLRVTWSRRHFPRRLFFTMMQRRTNRNLRYFFPRVGLCSMRLINIFVTFRFRGLSSTRFRAYGVDMDRNFRYFLPLNGVLLGCDGDFSRSYELGVRGTNIVAFIDHYIAIATSGGHTLFARGE